MWRFLATISTLPLTARQRITWRISVLFSNTFTSCAIRTPFWTSFLSDIIIAISGMNSLSLITCFPFFAWLIRSSYLHKISGGFFLATRIRSAWLYARNFFITLPAATVLFSALIFFFTELSE